MMTNIAPVVEILQKKLDTERWSRDSLISLTDEGNAVIQVYGSKEQFLKLFNPSMQAKYCKDVLRCYEGKAPTLKVLGEAYGCNVVVSWLYAQICDLSEFSNNPNKISIEQATELATIFFSEYSQYKVTEFMLFFYRFKLGRYQSRFYQSVDPIVIANAFREFRSAVNSELFNLYEEKERKEREAKRKESNKTRRITLDEYNELVKIGKIT